MGNEMILPDYPLSIVPKYIGRIQFRDNNIYYRVTTHDEVRRLSLFFNPHINTRTNMLVDISCADYPDNIRRYRLSYILLSTIYGFRIMFSFVVGHKTYVDSITTIFACAGWYEREIHDTFGVLFNDHSDSRRIPTDYGFYGNPLKKDFPLSGFVEVYYDESSKCVMYKDVSLVQEYRS